MGSEDRNLLDKRAICGTSLSELDLHQVQTEENTDKHADRISRLSRAKLLASELCKWGQLNRDKVPDSFDLVKFDNCGSHLEFRNYHERGQIKLARGKFCHQDKVCPVCAILKQAKCMKLLAPKIDYLGMGEFQGRPWYHIVPTIKNGPDLAERFNHYRAGRKVQTERARKLRNMGRGKHTEFAKVIGAYESIEVKRGAGEGLWHPHGHIIAVCSDYIDRDRLQHEWKEITGDSHNVHVELIDMDNDEHRTSALLECTKYVTKFTEQTPEDLYQLHGILKGKTLKQQYGRLRFSAAERKELAEHHDVLPEDEPFVRMIYEFLHGFGYALKAEVSSNAQPAFFC